MHFLKRTIVRVSQYKITHVAPQARVIEGVSAKVAIEELQKNCEFERCGDKGESDAHAVHIQSANRTARRYEVMIHHGIVEYRNAVNRRTNKW